jgi:hypothetical protein
MQGVFRVSDKLTFSQILSQKQKIKTTEFNNLFKTYTTASWFFYLFFVYGMLSEQQGSVPTVFVR